MLMTKLHRLMPILAIVLLAGCASPAQPVITHAAVEPSPTHPVIAPVAPVIPACFTMVGKNETDVLDANGSPRCITGTDVASDKTEYSVMNCDPVGNTGTPIYGWSSTDPNAPDRQVYAAKKGGVIVIVPVSASTIEMMGGVPVVNYLVAVGCQ